MVVWIRCPLSGVMISFEATGITVLGIAIVFLIFVFVSTVSVGIVLLLSVRTECFYGLCDHGFDRGFSEGCVDYGVSGGYDFG